MTTRVRYERELNELQSRILQMGATVEEQFAMALQAFDTLDITLAHSVQARDEQVNRTRFEIEDACFNLIVTQQPVARDLRLVLSAMNMIVDLERMGDQAKGVAKVVPHLVKYPVESRPNQLKPMGQMVLTMLHQAMLAYAQNNVDLAKLVASQDDQVDYLYGEVFGQVLRAMATAGETEQIASEFEMLRVAREIERFGDLATNVAERVIYQVTGAMKEYNVDRDADPEAPRTE